MARHDIEVELPPKVVLNSDVRFSVRSDGELLGELLVSKGSLAWRPGRGTSVWHLEWERFGELARESGRRQRLA